MRICAAGAVQEEELKAYTFQPSINPRDVQGYIPIQQRVGDIQREHKHNLQILRVSRDMADPDLTFSPATNPKSRHMKVCILSP